MASAMSNKLHPTLTPQSISAEALRPLHIVAGLGGAEREVLASCLALFEQASLGAHLGRLYDKGH